MNKNDKCQYLRPYKLLNFMNFTSFFATKLTFDTNELISGYYFIKISSEQAVLLNEKIIIIK